MTDTAPKTGLDALVEEAMQRKIVPTQQEAAAHTASGGGEAVEGSPPPPKPAPEPIGKAPDLTLHFMVNGVKVAVLVHVEPGATVTLPTTKPAAAQAGPKVRGVRNRATEPTEPVSVAPSAPEPIKTSEPFPNDLVMWQCPEHLTATVKKSQITGREYVVCGTPGCNQMAPK